MNYYDVLRINKDASSQEIKTSYKKLIKRYHPDLYPGNKTKAETITRDLNEAYEVLSDPEKRYIYDLSLQEPVDEATIISSKQQNIYYQEKNNIENKKSPNFEENLRKNIYEFVDKKTENLSSDSKNKILFIIIFLAFLILFITTNDFLNFQLSIKERKKQQEELKSQNYIYNDYYYNYYFYEKDNQNYSNNNYFSE